MAPSIAYCSAIAGTLLISAGFLAAPNRVLMDLLMASHLERTLLHSTINSSLRTVHIVDTLLAFFHNIFSTLIGKGIGVIFLSVQLPVLAFILLLGARQRPKSYTTAQRAILALSGILWIAVGQLITIGFALSAFWVPYYASIASDKSVRRATLSNPSATWWLSYLLPISMLTCSATALVSTESRSWPLANVTFQLYPLVFLPLASVNGPLENAQARKSNSARLFSGIGVASSLLWWFGLAIALLDFGNLDVGNIGPVQFDDSSPVLSPTLISIFTFQALPSPHLRATLNQELGGGAFFLIFDTLAVIVAMAAVVSIDRTVGESPTWTGDQFIRPLLYCLTGGPGLAAAMYWRDRSFEQESVMKSK